MAFVAALLSSLNEDESMSLCGGIVLCNDVDIAVVNFDAVWNSCLDVAAG
jgi:hypothetical protein